MAPQRYERIAADDNDSPATNLSSASATYPDSPPPSFRSRNSSRRQSRDDARQSEEERDLNDAFDAPSDDEDENQDQRRLIPSRRNSADSSPTTSPTSDTQPSRPSIPSRRVTEIPVFTPSSNNNGTQRVMGGGSSANDGVFANITAKPLAGEDLEEKPPTYEQAAADATPPYWETTVLSPYASTGDPNDVFVDGLLVGSFFSFIWNALISMSFQLIGFLLTYLLHTTHAAKHGSRAGLGITLVQYGFQMRYAANGGGGSAGSPMDGAPPPVPDPNNEGGVPPEPNKHDFDPSQVGSGADGAVDGVVTTADWLSYVLMIVGWFILIRAVSDFLRARRQEALVRSSPDRGLGVAVVAEGEEPERAV